ncbi:MAG: ShlB/FhaC/HecB family hemolysin secretion/activation protein [Vampirovibrionales bacterium]
MPIKTLKRHAYLISLLSAFGLTCLPAFADDVGGISPTSNPGSLTNTGLEQVNKKNRLDRNPIYGIVENEKIKPTDEVIKLDLPDAIGTPSFQIYDDLHHLQIVGNSVFTQADFKPLVDVFLASSRSTKDVQALIHQIDRKYYEKGYLTSKTFFESEANHTLVLRVVEGRVGHIEIDGNHFKKDKRILKDLKLNEGDVLNLKELQENVESINSSQDLYKVKARLSAGKEAGESVLTYEVEERLPFKLSVFSDNRGRPLIGQTRWGTEFEYADPLGKGDKLTLGYTGARGTTIAESAYTIPVNSKGTSVGVAYSFAYVHVQNRKGPDRLTGTAHNYSVFLNQNVEQIKGLSLSTGLNLRKITSFDNGVQSGESDVSSATAGFNWDESDKVGRSNLNGTVTAGAAFWGGDNTFMKYELAGTRIFNLPKNQYLVFNGYSMLSSGPLPGFEQMQIGGSSSVRGFTEGLLFGDRGFTVNAEYRYPIWGLAKVAPKLAENLQGVLFVDASQVVVAKNTSGRLAGASNRGNTTLVGTGAGLRLAINDTLEGFVDFGVGLTERDAVEPNAQPSVRVHFGIRSQLIKAKYKKRG